MNIYKIILALFVSGIVFTGFGCQLFPISEDKHFSGIRISSTPNPSRVSIYIVLGLSSYGNMSDGLAHYTEHLVWKSISQDGFRTTDQHSNAWTSNVAMGYWVSGSKEDFPKLLATLTGIFDPISVTPEFAAQELDIVLREYEYRLVNDVDAQATSAMNQFLYKGNPTAASVIGTPLSIAKLDYSSAKALHEETHQPGNAVLVVVGDVSKQEVMQAIEAAGVPSLAAGQQDEASAIQFQLAEPVTTEFTFNSPDTEPRMVLRKVVALEKAVDFEVLALEANQLSKILEANLTGGLAGPLRFDQFIARTFSVNVFPLDEQHIELRFEATPDSGVSFSQLQLAFETALHESAKGIPPSTFTRVKTRFDTFWPDWEDHKESANWMSNYVLKRVANLREPLSRQELQRLTTHSSLNGVNSLLEALQKPGRQVGAFIGNSDGEVQ